MSFLAGARGVAFATARKTAHSTNVFRRGGVTLIEMMVVVVIIGLFVALVGPQIFGQADKAKITAVKAQMEHFRTALGSYKLDTGVFPTTEQGLLALIARPSGVARWNGPYLKGEKVPEDPWGRPFVYRAPSQRAGHDFDLYSLGPTGQPSDSALILNE